MYFIIKYFQLNSIFASNARSGPNDEDLLLDIDLSDLQTSLTLKYNAYPVYYPFQDFCIRDISCFQSEGQMIFQRPSTEKGDFDLTQNFSYKSKVTYFCPPGMEFENLNGNSESLSFLCQQDGNWDRDPNQMNCKCKIFPLYIIIIMILHL